MHLPPYDEVNHLGRRKADQPSRQLVANLTSTSNNKDVCVCVTPPTCSDDGVHKQCDPSHYRKVHIQRGLQCPNSMDREKEGRRKGVREEGLINGHTKCESIHSPLMM